MNNQSMHPNQSSYNLWTWLVAILLAIFLLWKLLSGNGPTTAGCCAATVAPIAATAPDVTPDAAPVAESFKFNASCNDFTSTGDGAALAWFSNPDALKASLCGSENLAAAGDDKNVVLTGVVDTEATRLQKGDEAKAFFGPDVTVDNQINVKAAEATATESPPAAKLYFENARTKQPSDSADKLAPIVAWLNTHPDAKAFIAGFHDPRGSAAQNARLARGRADSTLAALVAAGIDKSRIEMREPADENGGTDLQEARRVEVSVE